MPWPPIVAPYPNLRAYAGDTKLLEAQLGSPDAKFFLEDCRIDSGHGTWVVCNGSGWQHTGIPGNGQSLRIITAC